VERGGSKTLLVKSSERQVPTDVPTHLPTYLEGKGTTSLYFRWLYIARKLYLKIKKVRKSSFFVEFSVARI